MFLSKPIGSLLWLFISRASCATSTTAPPSTPPFDFDPAVDDPNWPGQVPKPGTPNRLVINVQYDDYPREINWALELFRTDAHDNRNNSETASPLLPETASPLFTSSKTGGTNGNGNGTWEIVDQFRGDAYVGQEGLLVSYVQQYLYPETYYRFTIQDTVQDGFCCGVYGNGWVTLTTGDGDGVLWNLTGNELVGPEASSVTVDLYVDSIGTVGLATPPLLTSPPSPSLYYPPEAQSLDSFCSNLTQVEVGINAIMWDFIERINAEAFFEILSGNGYSCSCQQKEADDSHTNATTLILVCDLLFRYNLGPGTVTINNTNHLEFTFVSTDDDAVDGLYYPYMALFCENYFYPNEDDNTRYCRYLEYTITDATTTGSWTAPAIQSCREQRDELGCDCQVCFDNPQAISASNGCGASVGCEEGSTNVFLFEFTKDNPLILF